MVKLIYEYTCSVCKKVETQVFRVPVYASRSLIPNPFLPDHWRVAQGFYYSPPLFCPDHTVSSSILVDGKVFHEESD